MFTACIHMKGIIVTMLYYILNIISLYNYDETFKVNIAANFFIYIEKRNIQEYAAFRK